MEVVAVADQPALTVPSTISVDEDTQSAAFTISSAVVDSDGSESLTLEISDVPVGTTLTDGSHTFQATAGNRSVDVTGWTLTNLSVTPPAHSDSDFALTVTATATEAANGDHSTRTDTINVEVTAVADQPTLTVPSTISVDEDTRSADFTISSAMVDPDGSESLTLEISDVPVGVTLTDGSHTFQATIGNTRVDVSDWALGQLSLTPPADSDANFALTVTATSTETSNSDQHARTDTINVEVTAVADEPTLSVPSTIVVDEDTQSAAFTISSALTDSDSSETLTVTVSDVPAGTTLTDGSHTFTATGGNSTVDVTDWTLTNLAVTPAANSDADFALTVTATATETANGDQSQRSDTIAVEVTAVADQPTLTVPATVTVVEDTSSARFSIVSQLVDTDGSETLMLTVSDVPEGATLSDGRNTFTATNGNSSVEVTDWRLSRLTITPAADSDQDFSLTVTATATEAENSDQHTRTDTIAVEVTAVADQPSLTVPSTITVDEDTDSAAFSISSALADTDGSETLRLEISAIPVGTTLTDGSHTFTATSDQTTADVTDWALANLSLTPPTDSDADFTLTVTATATESANNDQSTRTRTINVKVAAVADQPTLTVPSTITVDEDTQSAGFTIESALVDTDGSESLRLEISNVPAGTTLTDGLNSFTATNRQHERGRDRLGADQPDGHSGGRQRSGFCADRDRHVHGSCQQRPEHADRHD